MKHPRKCGYEESLGSPFYLEEYMQSQKILYEVYKKQKKVGEFKVLSLGVEHIKRVCDMNSWNVSDYEIRQISDGKVVWKG